MAQTTIAGTFITGDSVTASQIAANAITNAELATTAITSQTAETTIAGDDVVLIYDTSASAFRKMTRTNFVAGIGGTTVNGTTDNAILTYINSSGEFTAESELKYNGAGNLYYSRAGTVQFDMVPTGGSSQAWALSARTDGTFRITNDTDGSIDINLTGDGEITTARQPCFQTKLDSSRDNVTGGGQSWQFGDTDNITDRFDVGSNVSSTGIFTAPVTGKYLLHGHLTIVNSGMDSAHDNYLLTVWTSNRSYDTFAGLYAMRAATANIGATSVKDSVIADMDAGDTAKLLFYVYDGSQTIDINEGNNSYFSGYLLG